MNEEVPHVRLFLSHPANYSQLDGEDLAAVEKQLREATYAIVGPTLISGWAANEEPLLRVGASPPCFVRFVPGVAEWTVANRNAYLLQQAQLIDKTYTVSAETAYFCDMCTPKKHCDSTCKTLMTAAGEPVMVSATYEDVTYMSKLVITLEWLSDPYESMP